MSSFMKPNRILDSKDNICWFEKILFRLKWNVCVVPVAYLPHFFNPTLNIKMVFREKIPKMDTYQIL